MYFKQFYLGCLAHASYLIGSEGEAAVVDPQRDVDQYVAEAESQGLKIKYVVETHLHADFVSGHRELAARTGAEIVFGERAGARFPHRAVRDGDELSVGHVRLRVLETPGHTPESISLVVVDMEVSAEPQKVLTGDTLFVGDVGRPDLAGARGHTPQEMAGMLYESLHGKLLKLDDAVEVWPAHGAGSMCGRNISKETSSTIGQQRRVQPRARADGARRVRPPDDDRPAGGARLLSRRRRDQPRGRAAARGDATPRRSHPATDRGLRQPRVRRARRARGRPSSARATSPARSTSGWAASSRAGPGR